MDSGRVQFEENLRRVRALGGLATAMSSLTTSVVDVSDIWRSQVVLAVSALDHLVHEITRTGMVEVAAGKRHRSEAYSRFTLPMHAVERALNGRPHEEWIGDAVREKHSWLSFQQPEKIADAIRLVSPIRLWDEVGRVLGIPAADVRRHLELVVDRRNKIAHEADMDPTNPGFRWPIDASLADDVVQFISNVGIAIVKSVQ